MYLNHDEIERLIADGYMLDTDQSCTNAASLDLRLGDTVLVECAPCDPEMGPRMVDYRHRNKMLMDTRTINERDGFYVEPGQVFLAHTVEKCNFPDDLAALFRIKSSMGRIFLEHMDAGWVDPGFHGSLTLEFKNMSQYHSILLRPGDRIGQLVFFRGSPVSADKSYRTRGNYNGNDAVAQVGYKQ